MDIHSPRIITPDKHVIDLLETNPTIWVNHISEDNKRRVIAEVQRWQTAVEAGADATEAYGYAVGGIGVDFQTWLAKEKEPYSS